MKNVLLTGASGFIGRHCLAPLLQRGFTVHAVSKSEPSAAEKGVHWHRADLLDSDQAGALMAEIRPTHLLHLAWYVIPGKLVSAPENFGWVPASLALLRSFTEQGGRRAVFSGSGYEYNTRYGYCVEGLTPAAPETIYGTCKQALHLLAESYSRQAGLSHAWGRVFFLYGPNEHPRRLVSSVILSLLRGEPARCSHGLQIRDYLHVQDVADGLVQLLDRAVEGTVNVCSGQATTVKEIVLAIGRLLQRPDLIQLGAIPTRADDLPLIVGQNTRLLEEVGWRQAFELEAGLRQTIAWWREQKPLIHSG